MRISDWSSDVCSSDLAREFPGLICQPSDPDAPARTSIVAWCERLTNVRAPLDLDAAAPNWPIDRADACVCINMVHVSPWEATLGLLAGAARVLPRGGPLVLYGPYRRDGVPTAASNEAFDARSEERRVGKECVSTCRYGGSPYP